MNNLLVNLSSLSSQPTGLTTYAKNLFPYFKFLNPTLLTTSPHPDFTYHLVPKYLNTDYHRRSNILRLIWTQTQLPQLYRQLQSNLLFSPVPEAPIYNNCRYIITVHDLIPLRFPRSFSPLTNYYRFYLPFVLRQAQHIICDSLATASDIREFFEISPNKITPIPLAYNSNHFCPPPEQSKGNYFLYLGRYDPYKNLQRLLDAFAKLPHYQDYELRLLGPSDSRYTPHLKHQAKELNISNQVKFLNYLPYNELPSILAGAIALVLPSLWEGFGLPVLEAMACGTPVITSNLSSLPEVAGDAALLIDPYRIEEITAAIKTVATDEEVRSQLSKLGLERVKQFSWQKTGQATIEVIERFL